MLGRVFQCTGETQQLRTIHTGLSDHVGQSHLAAGDGAGLIEHDGVDLASGLQHLRTLDEDAHLRTAPGADEQRGRGCQTQRAGAGDDEHGDRCGERGGDGEPASQPGAEGDERDDDDDRHEDAGDAIGQTLHLGLAGLRVLDELRHLCELCVRTHTSRPHDQAAAGVDGGTGDRVALADLDRHGLAGEHRGVHRGGAGGHETVGGDLLAWTDDELVADRQLRGGDLHLYAVAEYGDFLRAQLQEGAQRGPGLALGSLLEVAAGEDEHRHARADFEVDVRRAIRRSDRELEGVRHAGSAGSAEEERVERPEQCDGGAHRDERVHRRRTVLEVCPRRLVERPSSPDDHRCGQGE